MCTFKKISVAGGVDEVGFLAFQLGRGLEGSILLFKKEKNM